MNHANGESGNPERESQRETFQLAQRTAPSLVLPRHSRDRIDALQRAERQKKKFHRRFSLFRKPAKYFFQICSDTSYLVPGEDATD